MFGTLFNLVPLLLSSSNGSTSQPQASLCKEKAAKTVPSKSSSNQGSFCNGSGQSAVEEAAYIQQKDTKHSFNSGGAKSHKYFNSDSSSSSTSVENGGSKQNSDFNNVKNSFANSKSSNVSSFSISSMAYSASSDSRAGSGVGQTNASAQANPTSATNGNGSLTSLNGKETSIISRSKNQMN